MSKQKSKPTLRQKSEVLKLQRKLKYRIKQIDKLRKVYAASRTK